MKVESGTKRLVTSRDHITELLEHGFEHFEYFCINTLE